MTNKEIREKVESIVEDIIVLEGDFSTETEIFHISKKGEITKAVDQIMEIVEEEIREAEILAWENGYQCGFFKLDIEKSRSDYLSQLKGEKE